MRYLTFFFSYKAFGMRYVFYTDSPFQLGLAAFQVLRGLRWLLTTTLLPSKGSCACHTESQTLTAGICSKVRFYLQGANCQQCVLSFPDGSIGKESACHTGDLGSIPGLRRSPGEGKSYPLQYSGLENSMDRGAWQAIVHGVEKSWT